MESGDILVLKLVGGIMGVFIFMLHNLDILYISSFKNILNT